ncbi:MAG: peptide ABC transporter substrate-binding protein [Vampirovibrionales bacterium]|nr:peptide ABC transporter substrate-binding protein [Vampirovibrionales bacterium]
MHYPQLLLILALSAGLLSGCSAPEPAKSSKIQSIVTLNLGSEPPSLDPAHVTDLSGFSVVNNLLRGLVTFQDTPDGQTKIVPAVAERWTQSADGKTYTFNLRPQATWQDGQPVTSAHFLAALERALNPATAAEYAFFLFPIAKAEAYSKGQIHDFSQVGVYAPDARTLVIKLTQPNPFFLQLLASPIALPVRPEVIAKQAHPFTEAKGYMSNGPFTLADWQHEVSLTLTRNPRYAEPGALLTEAHKADPDNTNKSARSEPLRQGSNSTQTKPPRSLNQGIGASAKAPSRVQTVQFLMIPDPNTALVLYDSGALDYVDTLPPNEVLRLKREAAKPGAYYGAYHEQPLFAINYLGLNTLKPPLTNVRVRQALAMSIDRSLWPKLLPSGAAPYNGLIAPGLLGADAQSGLPFNPQQARALLKASGINVKQPITLAFRAQFALQREAELIQFCWEKHLGLNVRLMPMDWKAYLALLANPNDPNAPHVHRMNWYVDYPDTDSLMGLFTSSNGNNHIGWANHQYDALIAQAAVTQTPGLREKLYMQAEQLLLRKAAAVIPVTVPLKTYLLRPGIEGFGLNRLNVLSLEELAREGVRGRERTPH